MMYQPFSRRATWLLLFTLLLAAITVRPALPSDGAVTFKGITIKIDVGVGPGAEADVCFRLPPLGSRAVSLKEVIGSTA
jgi:hypothetical protein